MTRLDRWLGPSLTLLALAWLWLAYTYIPDARTEGEPGPRAFPILLGVVLAGLGMSMAVMALGFPRRDADAIPPFTRREGAFAAGTVGLLVLYAFLLDTVGFLFGTPVVIALTMCGLLRMRRWVLIVSLAAAFTLGCWVIFDALLGTPLPRGAWVVW